MQRINQRGIAAIGLDRPKNHENIGSVLRAAFCYGASMVAHTGQRYQKSSLDTCSAYRHIPFIGTKNLQDVIPLGCIPVAVDLVEGASNLVGFVHPESAFYIFGPEDGTLQESTLKWCKHKIYVPTAACMNLAATVNVILYDRMAKQQRR